MCIVSHTTGDDTTGYQKHYAKLNEVHIGKGVYQIITLLYMKNSSDSVCVRDRHNAQYLLGT